MFNAHIPHFSARCGSSSAALACKWDSVGGTGGKGDPGLPVVRLGQGAEIVDRCVRHAILETGFSLTSVIDAGNEAAPPVAMRQGLALYLNWT